MVVANRKGKPVPSLRPELELEARALLERGRQPEELVAYLRQNGYQARDAKRLATHLDQRYQGQLRGETPGTSIDALIDKHASRKSGLFGWLAAAALFAAGIWYASARQPDDLGEPCRGQSDCDSGLCMLEVSEDRRVTSGYCSKPCGGLATCDSGLVCQDVVEGSGQPGQAWDGMSGKSFRACVKP